MTDCKEYQVLEIKQNGNITMITNHSQYKLIISILPVKPKRKHRDYLLVAKQTFYVLEHGLDLTSISFRFVND